jgi:hypothetical protein
MISQAALLLTPCWTAFMAVLLFGTLHSHSEDTPAAAGLKTCSRQPAPLENSPESKTSLGEPKVVLKQFSPKPEGEPSPGSPSRRPVIGAKTQDCALIGADTVLHLHEALHLGCKHLCHTPFSSYISRLFGSISESARRHPPVLSPGAATLRPNKRLFSNELRGR